MIGGLGQKREKIHQRRVAPPVYPWVISTNIHISECGKDHGHILVESTQHSFLERALGCKGLMHFWGVSLWPTGYETGFFEGVMSNRNAIMQHHKEAKETDAAGLQ